MTPTDKAREALREIKKIARQFSPISKAANDMISIADAALADEGEREEVWTVHDQSIYGPDGIYAACGNKPLAHRIAAVPRLERIERAARTFRDAVTGHEAGVRFVVGCLDEYRALDRALNEGEGK